MKIRATIEFDLETIDGEPIEDHVSLVPVSHDLPDIIRNRLFGAGFLPDDVQVGTYTVNSEIVL